MSVMAMHQVCTYWPPGTWDGEKHAFGSAQVLACRWQAVTKLVRSKEGKEVVSDATVYLPQAVDGRGRLALGTGSGSTPSADAVEPISVAAAAAIDGSTDHWKVYL